MTDNKCKNDYGAKLDSLQGKVFFDPESKGNWQQAKLHDVLCEGSRVRVELYSRASLSLSNGVVLRLDEGTVLSLNGIAPDQPTLLDLLTGFIHFISRTPRRLEVTSPIANAGPEGTEFAMSVDDTQASLWVYEGGVRFFNSKGSVSIKPGQGAKALAGRAPRAQIDIKPQDAVNWALYYPPLLPYPDASAKIDAGIRTAIQDFRHGRIDDSLFRLDALASEQRSPFFYKVRGAMRLTAGRVELAEQDIRAILANKPNDAEALALQSVLALTQNRKEEALQLANKALTSDPASPTAYSALSYAEQGRFELDKALVAADQATKYAPHDAMVWARKAELEFSKGLIKNSQKAARRALELDAGLERTQTVTGFSYLLRMEADDAIKAFERAVQLDSTSPLARLGLGLAKIRDGDLDEGRHDLEIAAILDPNNSIVRSYLGKAYYEERRSSLAQDQFDLAKQRDPKDPTPFFYDAINKQTTNRPVEALHDMQKAIELNDNRGVYRSKLLLDSDSAARSASLGRIFNDLGFQQLGLLEGWISINNDPSNYSAHRLLADNYVALPRHEIARVSELLKAQLLQPVNITPVQPQTAESNILILDGLGSSITSFNEYNPLFTRNRFALQASGFYGSHDSISDEIVQSGVWDKFSYSLGQFHYQTEGYRPNNEQKKDAYNLFAQAEITHNTNVQVELRKTDEKFGDNNQNFFSSDFSLISNGQKENDIVRGGLHHKFSENSDLLVSVIYRQENSSGLDDSQDSKFNFSRKTDGTQYEIQDIYRHNYFDSVVGINYLINQNGTLKVEFDGNEGSFNDESEHIAFYLYSNIKLIPKLIVTVGFTQDFYQQNSSLIFQGKPFPTAEFSRNPLSPKLGLTWTPTKDTTLRFAAFQSLKRGIIQKQTLEPTQVTGFNQFFDDIDGSIAQRIGFGLDHKFNAQFLAGAEISRRYLDILYPSIEPPNNYIFEKTKWNEKNARSYLNWTPNDRFAFGINYYYEKLNRKNDGFFDTNNNSNFFTQLETHRTELFGNYYHPSGFLAKLNLMYLSQSGNFLLPHEQPYTGLIRRGATGFWLLDSEIGYRLPQRHGLITLGVKNLLNENFNYQGTDLNFPSLPHDRFFFSRVTFSF